MKQVKISFWKFLLIQLYFSLYSRLLKTKSGKINELKILIKMYIFIEI